MTEPLTSDQVFIRKLNDIILANLGNENFGARELARECGLSMYRLNHRLQTANFKTTSQFIRERRLQIAYEMLQDEKLTVSEIAFKTGFRSPSYFVSSFHEYFGYPPGKARKDVIESHYSREHESHNSKLALKSVFKRVPVLISSAILVLCFLTYVVYSIISGQSPDDSGAIGLNTRKTIAVLPFINLSDNTSDQYVYDGIMDEIFNSLTKVGELGVIARTSVEQYRNTTKTIAEIGKELDVDYIVEGSGQKFGNTFRMRMQLIEVSTGLHIWSESFQHKIKMTRKLFRIQGRIAESIASELKTSLTAKEKKLLEKVPTSDISAYNLYTEANSIQDDIKSTSNDSAYRRAVKLYNAAIQADPSFARAYTGLASAYWNRYYYEKYFEKNYLDTCLFFAREALELDDQLDEAYFMQGEYYRIKGQHYEALQKYDKALDINPNYFQAYYRKGYLLIWVLGDYVKGLDNLHKALALIRGNGRSVILKSLGVTYRDAGFPEKAKYYFDEALILDGNEASYLGNIAFVEFSKGNFEEAVNLSKQKEKMDDSYNSLGYYCVIPDHKDEAYSEALKEAEKFKKSGTLSLQKSHRIGYAFWQAGKKEEAEYYFKQQIRYGEESIKLNREIEQRKAAQYDLAGTYAFLGDKVLAYKNLDEFAERKRLRQNTCQNMRGLVNGLRSRG